MIPRIVVAPACLLLMMLIGCVNPMDPEIRAFTKFRQVNQGSIPAAYQELSDDQKIAIFFGSIKTHPPSDIIEPALSTQPVSFLATVRDEIRRREFSVAAYALNSAIIEKRRRGEISLQEIDSLRLADLCAQTRADATVCATQIGLMK